MPTLPFDIGLYTAVEQVGIGGMGRVYRGIAPDGKEVAIKTMHPHLAEREEFVRRFMLEAERLQRVAHPGVVRVYEYGKAEVSGTEVPYIVMEFVHGRKLSDILENTDTGTADFPLSVDIHPIYGKVIIPQDGVVRILRQMAYILQACSQVNVVHRDIKPQNIIITDPSWGVKLIDFGIAKDIAEQYTLSETGHVLGTPAYMSPEQCKGAKDVDIRIDIYALGVVAYRCLTGRVPFEAENLAGYIRKHLEEPPIPIRQLNPNVDENLALIVERMIAKEPEHRHQKPDELIEDLQRYERGEPPVRVYDWETRTTYETKTEMKVARRHAKVRNILHFIGLGVGIAIAVIVLALLIARWMPSKASSSLIDPVRPFLTKANSLAVKKLPEAAAFWYEKALKMALKLAKADKLKKADIYIRDIEQMVQEALETADSEPLLLVRPDSKNRELLSRFVRRYWSPLTPTEPKNLPETINWSDKKRLAEVLRGEHGIRYVLQCTLTATADGWQATLTRLDLRTGQESTYQGVQKTPERAVEDAFLASKGMNEKQRRVHWLLVEAKSSPSRDRAIELYRRVLTMDRTVKEAKEALHRLYIEALREYLRKKRFAEALTVANAALQVLPDDKEVRHLKEEAEKMLQSLSRKKRLERAIEALRRGDWEAAIREAVAVLEVEDDERAEKIKEAALAFRTISEALSAAKLITARRKINSARKLRPLAPDVYDSLLNKLEEAEKRYDDLLRRIDAALKEGRFEDVKRLVKQAKSANSEDTIADRKLADAEKALYTYNAFVVEAEKALRSHRYKDALVWIRKAANLRKSGPHLEMKQKAEEALKKREHLQKQIEAAAAEERWEEVIRLGAELLGLYPKRGYSRDVPPERVVRLVGYAKAIIEAEKYLKVRDLKRAYNRLRRARSYKIGSKKEEDLRREWRLRWLYEGDLVYQKVVNAGGDVVCVAGAPDRSLLIAGLANGRFAVISADCQVERVFTPPSTGVKPVTAAFVRTNFLLLWSDGSLQMRRRDGSLILSRKLPAPRWACSLGDAVIMWDGRKLHLLGERQRQVEMSDAQLLGVGTFLALRRANGKIALLDPHTLRVKSELFVIGEAVSCATSRRMVALGLKNGVIELRRSDGGVVRRIKRLRSFPTVLLFDRTGDLLISVDEYRNADVIEVSTGQVLWSRRLKCWAPAGATIVGLNDIAVRGETGELVLILPSLRP